MVVGRKHKFARLNNVIQRRMEGLVSDTFKRLKVVEVYDGFRMAKGKKQSGRKCRGPSMGLA